MFRKSLDRSIITRVEELFLGDQLLRGSIFEQSYFSRQTQTTKFTKPTLGK